MGTGGGAGGWAFRQIQQHKEIDRVYHVVQEGPGQPFIEEPWRRRLVGEGPGCRLRAGLGAGEQ